MRACGVGFGVRGDGVVAESAGVEWWALVVGAGAGFGGEDVLCGGGEGEWVRWLSWLSVLLLLALLRWCDDGACEGGFCVCV